MTTSLLATLIFCGLIFLSLGVLIYLGSHIKTRNPYPLNRGYRGMSWLPTSFRPGTRNPGAELKESERSFAFMEAGRRKRLRQRQRHAEERRFYS